MAEEKERMEKTLIKLLEYQKEQHINSQDLMTMMSLISLMSMIDVLNRDKPTGAAAPDALNLQAMLGPLLGLMATGMGSGGGGETGKQPPFNPAMLFNLLSAFGGGQAKGGQPKSGQPDLSGLMWLLAPLLGGQFGAFKQSPAQGDTSTPVSPPQPVQREINLDLKEGRLKENDPKDSNLKESNSPTEIIISVREDEKKEKLPKPGEVLEWKFGVS